MEIDQSTSQSRPPISPPRPRKPEVLNQPAGVDEEGMREWAHKMGQ